MELGRRQFLADASAKGAGFLIISAGLGFPSRGFAVRTYRDIRVQSDLGPAGTLTAQQIKDGLAVATGVLIDEGGHQHNITITADEMRQLQEGKVVRKRSEQAAGHDHGVVIDPSNLVPGGNTIEGQDNPTPTPNPGTTNNPPGPPNGPPDPGVGTSSPFLSALLGDGRRPYIYLQSTEQLKPGSVYICLGNDQACDPNRPWSLMENIDVGPGKNIFASRVPLDLQPSTVVHFYAETVAGKRGRLAFRIRPNG